MTEIVIPDGVITIGDKAFSSCSKVVDIQLPTTLTTVGQDAFSNCSSLVKLSIPAGTLTLGDGAFGGCRSLQEVEFTGNDVTLGKSVFYNCLNMNKMTLSASKMYLGASLFAKTGIETLVIDSNDITTDPDLYLERELYYPGYKDKNIKKLVISKNVTTLNEALYLPVTIWQVEVEDGNTTYAIEENVLYNKDKTELIRFFSNNAEYNYRDKFTVPETVTKIGNKAFLGARVYLVELPSALEVIGEQAFYNSVVSGSQERYVFTLPASVKKIGSRAFGITPIRYFNIIEGNLEKLTPNMFHGAYALTDVYYTGDKEKLDEIISYTEGSYLSSCRFHYNTTSSEHPFSETIGKKATAHENGYYLYTCPCEQSYTLPIHKINEFIVAYSTVADHFSTEVSVAPAHQLPTRLIHGHDYTYQLSTYDAKDGHLAIKYSFMGDLYEGTYTKVEPVEIGAVKSLTTERTAANSAILTWKKPTVAKGYKIWRKEVGTNTWKLIATTSKLSYTDTSLAGDKHYQYKVSAYITVMNTCDITSDKSVTVDVLPYGNTLVKIDGVWRHVVNGKLVNDTTLVKYNGKYLYVRNGVYTKDTTLVKYNGKYHYVKNGVYTKGTTLVKYNDSYYYVKDGVLNYSDTLVKYNGKYFHVKNGKYVKDTTLTKYNGKYFYVKNGTYTKATTLAKYNGKYFYVKNGTYTKATTLAKYNGKYLYVKNGTYTKATTLAKYNGKYFYVKNGTYTKATTLVKYNGKYLYVKNGTYTKATTLVKYNGKYHDVRNGVYTKANTTVKYNGKTYKVKNGIAII